MNMNFSTGSEKYGTSIMKSDECLLFIEACLESGAELQEAISDMRMIDTLLYIKHLHLIVHGAIKKTKAGYYRKGTELHNDFERIIEARTSGLI